MHQLVVPGVREPANQAVPDAGVVDRVVQVDAVVPALVVALDHVPVDAVVPARVHVQEVAQDVVLPVQDHAMEVVFRDAQEHVNKVV